MKPTRKQVEDTIGNTMITNHPRYLSSNFLAMPIRMDTIVDPTSPSGNTCMYGVRVVELDKMGVQLKLHDPMLIKFNCNADGSLITSTIHPDVIEALVNSICYSIGAE